MEGQTAAAGDVQSPQAPKGQDYGQAVAQLDAQRTIPIAGNPHAKSLAQAMPSNIPPGSLPGLDAETAYPNEPVTTGLPIGPGAGPEALMTGIPAEDPDISRLRAIYQKRPSAALRRLIESAEQAY